MQYDSIEELTLELALYPNKKTDILEDCARKCRYGWFVVAKDGNCALFDKTGELDDINKVKRLTFIMIPEDVHRINIPSSVTIIDEYAFQDREQLEYVHIPDSVKFIAEGAFDACRSLSSIQLPDSLHTIEQCVFNACTNLKKVQLPSYLEAIYDYAFNYCSSLKSLVIPSSIKQIGFNAFSHCNSLEDLEINLQSEKQYTLLTTYAYPWGIIGYESVIKFKGIAV